MPSWFQFEVGPCRTCRYFEGWIWDREAVRCAQIGRFSNAATGCWRWEREPGSDDEEPDEQA